MAIGRWQWPTEEDRQSWSSITTGEVDEWWKKTWGKVDFTQLAMTSSVAGLRRSSKALPKSNLHQKRWRLLVVCCQSNPLKCSESWKNHYRENASTRCRKCFPRLHWIKHGFLCYKNKQTFLTGKNVLIIMVPILINKDVSEPSYNDLKLTIWNSNYFFTNLINSAAMNIGICVTLCVCVCVWLFELWFGDFFFNTENL